MGQAERTHEVPHAARGPAADCNVTRSSLKRLAADRRGATAIEYAMIASLVSVLIVTAVSLIGTTLSGFFQTLAASV